MEDSFVKRHNDVCRPDFFSSQLFCRSWYPLWPKWAVTAEQKCFESRKKLRSSSSQGLAWKWIYAYERYETQKDCKIYLEVSISNDTKLTLSAAVRKFPCFSKPMERNLSRQSQTLMELLKWWKQQGRLCCARKRKGSGQDERNWI